MKQCHVNRLLRIFATKAQIMHDTLKIFWPTWHWGMDSQMRINSDSTVIISHSRKNPVVVQWLRTTHNWLKSRKPSLEVAPTTLATQIWHECYWFTPLVSNSGLVFSHGQLSQQSLSSCFPRVTLNFYLWPWPSNMILTWIATRWTSKPCI